MPKMLSSCCKIKEKQDWNEESVNMIDNLSHLKELDFRIYKQGPTQSLREALFHPIHGKYRDLSGKMGDKEKSGT